MTEGTKQKLQEAIREMRNRYHDAIATEIRDTDSTYSEIAERNGVSEQTVLMVARVRGLCRTAPRNGDSHG